MSIEKKQTKQSRGRPRTFDRNAALIEALKVFWRKGYELSSIEELCRVMGIKPSSLYAAFGSKAQLFLEAVTYYERTYWNDAWVSMAEEPDLHIAIDTFFKTSAIILSSQDVPCGCLVVLSAIYVSPSSIDVFNEIKALREEGVDHFLSRLTKAVSDGQLSPDIDLNALAISLNTFFEGLSIPAQDGVSQEILLKIASFAVNFLPPKR